MSNISSGNTTNRSQKKFIFFSIFLSLVFSLIVAEWALRYQRQTISSSEHMDPGMVLYDAQLGWRLKPYWSGQHEHFDYKASYAINKNGFRGVDILNESSSYEVDSYIVVGDSFSFGLGVDDDETFTALLNNTGETFYNLSVPGYSTDQQLLLLKKLSHKVSRHVVLVVYLGNDVFDNMLAYPLQADHAKPYFKLTDNALVLKNTPVPLQAKPAAARKQTISNIVLAEDEQANAVSNWLAQLELSRRLGLFHSTPVLTKDVMQQRFSEPLELLLMLLNEIDMLVRDNNGALTVILMPGRSYLEQPSGVSAQYQEYFRAYISASLEESESISLMDLASYLKSLHNRGISKLYYPNEGHLTVLGHQYVADYLSDRINTSKIDQ